MTPWEEVYKSKEYQSLPFGEQVQAKLQYFSDVVVPEIDTAEIPEARRQFISYTNDLDRPKSGILSEIGAGASKLGGVVLGTSLAPLSFIRGMQNAPYIEGSPEEWNKLPWYKKPLVMLGGGLESAGRSIAKEGDFGEQYDAYYSAMTGSTLEKDFGKGAPYLKFAIDLINDPLFGPALGVSWAKQGVRTIGQFVRYIKKGTIDLGTQEMIKIPKTMMGDINKLEQMDVAEKQALRQELTDFLRSKVQTDAAGQGIKVGDNFMAYDTPKSSPFSPELAADVQMAGRPALPDLRPKQPTPGMEVITGDKQLSARGAGAEIVGDYVMPKGVANTRDIFSDSPTPLPKKPVAETLPEVKATAPAEEIVQPGAPSGGKQEVLYHGTNAEYADMEITTGKKMYGIHLTSDEAVAKDYGQVKKYVLSKDAKTLDLSDGDGLWEFMKKEGILDAEDMRNVDLERYTKNGQLFQYDISSKTHLADDVAKTAESLGYDVVKMPDDLGGRGDNIVQVVVNKKVLQSPSPLPEAGATLGGTQGIYRVYHGSPEGEIKGNVVYFADKPEIANIFAESPVSGKMGKVIAADIEIKNPYYAEGADFIENAGYHPEMIEPLKQQGYDGVIFQNKKTGHTEYLVFDKSQIKSPSPLPKAGKANLAFHAGGIVTGVDVDEDGNLTYDFAKGAAGGLLGAGALKLAPFLKKSAATQKLFAQNPEWGKVHDMVGKEKSSFSLMGMWNSFMRIGIDRFNPIREVSEKTYDAAIKFQSYKDVASIKLGELKPYFSAFGKKDEVLVSDYVLAKRALNRADNEIQNPNNVTSADARKAIEQMESQYASKGGDIANLHTAADGFHNWAQRNILKEARDNGFISQKAYDKIKINNQFYATYDVLEHMPDDISKLPQMPSGEYFSQANQTVIRAMKGTEKAIADPMEATIRKFVSAQASFAKNKVASIFIDDPATSQIVRPFAKNAKEFQIMTAQGKNPVTTVPKDWDTINRFKDGFVERYVAPKEYTEAMKQMTPWQAPQIVQGLNSIFRSSATTLYLPFTIGNAFRDAFMAFVTSPVYKGMETIKFPVDWTKGFYEGLKHEFAGKSPAVEGYLKSGGGFGWSGEVKDVAAVKEKLFSGTLDIVKNQANILKQIEKLSGAVELAPRMGIYERAIQQGSTMEEAATLARKGTIDFNRAGSATKVFNQFVPFLNARVQSRVLMVEALKNDPVGTMGKAFVSTILPGAALYAFNRQYYSDLYDDIPDYTRENYFTFITGTATDEKGREVPKYFVIPKGDIGQMIWNPIEHTIDKMWKKDSKSTGEFLMQFASDVSPIGFARRGELSIGMLASNITPPGVKGVVEDIFNESLFTGQEIVPYYMEKNKPKELQFKENTPESYKWIAQELKDKVNISMSPLRMQNFMSSLFAGYGREGLDPKAMMKGLTGRFYKESGGQKERDTWDIIKDIESGYNTARSYAEEFVKNDDRNSALKLMQKWNDGMDKQLERMEKEGIADQGGVRKDYLFTFEKMKGVMKSGIDQRTPLQKKIMVK